MSSYEKKLGKIFLEDFRKNFKKMKQFFMKKNKSKNFLSGFLLTKNYLKNLFKFL